MSPSFLERRLPGFLRRHIFHFEAQSQEALARFARDLPEGARVLDAGAGDTPYAKLFPHQRYVAVDLRTGDRDWDYVGLDAVADLVRLPFRDGAFDACTSILALQSGPDPAAALAEIARVLNAGAPLLLIAPHEWEVRRAPRDYFRFTRYGVRSLMERAGFVQIHVYPAGGIFRLLSRRLLNALVFFPGVWRLFAAAMLVPPALVLPAFDRLDRERNFTLGYLCTGKKSS